MDNTLRCFNCGAYGVVGGALEHHFGCPLSPSPRAGNGLPRLRDAQAELKQLYPQSAMSQPAMRYCEDCGTALGDGHSLECLGRGSRYIMDKTQTRQAQRMAQMQQQVDPYSHVKGERDAARDALAVSEKERERLKAENEDLLAMKKLRGEPDAPKFKTIDGEIVGNVLAERAALRRELENLKRSTDMKLADTRQANERFLEENQVLLSRAEFAERELERERQKTRKKRGL